MREAWDASDDDLLWYAAYGSNLSAARFSCYISGGVCEENGRTYTGCLDKTPPRAVLKRSFPGTIYIGNSSRSWNNCGVAFYDPSQRGENDVVYMKLYLITREQMHDVWQQEGMSPNWYGRLVCLDVDDNGIPVYTFTSESRRPPNAPAPAYIELMRKALEEEFKLDTALVAKILHRGF